MTNIDKRTSLVLLEINNRKKKFYEIGLTHRNNEVASDEEMMPRAQCHKTFFVRNLRIFVLS